MKNVKNLLIIVLFVSFSVIESCKEKKESEKVSVEQKDTLKGNSKQTSFFNEENEEIQIFKFPTNLNYLINGKNGTIINIPKDILVYEDGTLPTDSITITLKEYYDLFDIMSKNLSTQTTEKLLETGGMVHISAESKNGVLKIKEGMKYTIAFPNNRKAKKGMKLFKGKQESDIIVWDKIMCNETIEKVIDTIYTEGGNLPVYQKDLDNYLFNSFDLGWLNCDRILEGSNTLASAEWNETEIPSMRMIFKNFRSAAYASFENNKLTFYNIPINEPATIIGFYKIDGLYYYYKEEVSVSENMHFIPKFNEIKLSELENIIKSINWDKSI